MSQNLLNSVEKVRTFIGDFVASGTSKYLEISDLSGFR